MRREDFILTSLSIQEDESKDDIDQGLNDQ